MTRSFDVFFDLRLNKRLSKQPSGWWFQIPSWSLWRQCNDATGIVPKFSCCHSRKWSQISVAAESPSSWSKDKWVNQVMNDTLYLVCIPKSMSGHSLISVVAKTGNFLWFIQYFNDDIIKWTHFPHYWPFVRRIHQSLVDSPQKGQWRGALMCSLICAWPNGWANKQDAGDLRCHRIHYDVTVMNHPNPLLCWMNFRKHQNIFALSINPQNWDGTGGWNPFLWKTRTHLSQQSWYIHHWAINSVEFDILQIRTEE